MGIAFFAGDTQEPEFAGFDQSTDRGDALNGHINFGSSCPLGRLAGAFVGHMFELDAGVSGKKSGPNVLRTADATRCIGDGVGFSFGCGHQVGNGFEA